MSICILLESLSQLFELNPEHVRIGYNKRSISFMCLLIFT